MVDVEVAFDGRVKSTTTPDVEVEDLFPPLNINICFLAAFVELIDFLFTAGLPDG